MKTIGLIGGLSWESTAHYYRRLNESVKQQFGGLHSAKCLIYSFDFQEIADLQKAEKWKVATEKMVTAGLCLKAGGAELLVICTNTMHLMADDVSRATGLPLIHIVDALANDIKTHGFTKVGLLGTSFTMEKPFYKERMVQHGIELLTPAEQERTLVHDVIFSELCLGKITPKSKAAYLNVIDHLVARGAEGVILGCTEIPLLIKQCDTPVPLFDSTNIHADYALSIALNRFVQGK
ncbi:aspartate/glutamate racemase family protein [Bacillus sp. FSL W7-1360]